MPITPGARLGPYEIVEPIGAGGMGEVYRARDPRLDRDVAVKVLPAEVGTDPDRLRRLKQEARAAAALNHPNVLAVHDVGEAEGRAYIVSELLQGATLRAVVAKGRIAPRQAIDYGIQIAEGLAAAHEQGIVHRDLKPENVFVCVDGRVKILDFGLAKVVIPPSGGNGDVSKTATKDTSEGMMVGTPAYMSPEQVRGEPVDHRSDIFSFGSVLYEMLSASRAFGGASVAETVSGILLSEPPRLSVPGGQVDGAALERVYRRAIEKTPARRFQSARDLAFALSLALDVRSTRPRKAHVAWVGAAAAGAIILAAAPFAWRSLFTRDTGAMRIAVLPFVNESGDPNTQYISDGLTEALINRLSRASALQVVARSSVVRLGSADPAVAGQTLNARAVLVGRVATRGAGLTTSVALLDVDTGSNLWGQQYEHAVAELQSIQEDVTRSVARRLRVALSGEEEERLNRRSTVSTAAYETYLRARFEMNKRTPSGMTNASQMFRAATTQDPAFADAYAGAAKVESFLVLFGVRPPVALGAAQAAADEAIRLDPNGAEGHTARAMTALYGFDWKTAESEFRRAVTADPRSADAHHFFSHFLVTQGRSEESLAESRAAAELEPQNANLAAHVAWHYYFARDYLRAQDAARMALEVDPAYYQAFLFRGEALAQQRDYTAAIADLERALAARLTPSAWPPSSWRWRRGTTRPTSCSPTCARVRAASTRPSTHSSGRSRVAARVS